MLGPRNSVGYVGVELARRRGVDGVEVATVLPDEVDGVTLMELVGVVRLRVAVHADDGETGAGVPR